MIGLDPGFTELPVAMRTSADALGLPILTTPYSVSFVVIERDVCEAIVRGDEGRLPIVERIYSAVRTSLSQRGGGNALRRLAHAVSHPLIVLDPHTLTPILASTIALDPRLREALSGEMVRYAGSIPGVLHLHAGSSHATVVEVPSEEPCLLVVLPAQASTPDLPVLQHLATAVAVILTENAMELEHLRRLGAELFAGVLSGHIFGPSVEDGFARFDLDPTGGRVIAIDSAGDERTARLHLAFTRRGVAHLMVQRTEVLLVFAHAHEPVVSLAHDRLGTATAIGVSRPIAHVLDMEEAVREAVWSMQVARQLPTKWVSYESAPVLLALQSPQEARALVDRTLGPLIEYDREHDSQLIETLNAYLAAERSFPKAAEQLHVHRQTVVYRLNKIRAITGRDPHRTSDIALFWLALTALETTAVTSQPKVHLRRLSQGRGMS